MTSLLTPVLSFSNGLGGLFGGGDSNFGGIANLLNIQMDMLENMSTKLDLIKDSLDIIISNQEELAKQLEATPSKTVLELYKKDIESLFIILREKVAAYIIEKENGVLTAEKTSLIFDEILRELQIARAKVMGVEYLNIPIVATCLHFEILLMIFANQPKSYIQVVLNSYKNWFEKVSAPNDKLYKSYSRQFEIQNKVRDEIFKKPPYKRVITEKHNDKVDNSAKPKKKGNIIIQPD